MNALRAVPSLLLALGVLLSPRSAAAQTAVVAHAVPAVLPVVAPVLATTGRALLPLSAGLQDLRLQTPLTLPSQPAVKTDAKAATLDPFSVGEVISKVEYTPEGLPMQLLPVPVDRQIEVRFVSDAYLPEVSALLGRLGLSVVSKINPDRFIVAVAQDADARALADELEKEPLVLYATAKSFTLPIERQVSVTFKKVSVRSIPMGSGKVNVEQSVTDEEVAGILRSRGLRVLEIRADGYRVGAEGLDAEAAARELAADPLVLEAHPAKNQPSSDRWISVTFVRSYVVMTDGGWGIEVGMDDDTVADFLKKHGLQLVLVGGGDWSYLLAPVGDRPVDEVVAELAQNGLIASAVRSEDPAPPAAAAMKIARVPSVRPVLPAAKAIEELGARIAERLRAVSDAPLDVSVPVVPGVLRVLGARGGVSAALEPAARPASKIDLDLQERLKALPAKGTVSVILTLAEPIGPGAKAVRKRLKAMGVRFTELEGLGMIVAPLTRAQAKALAALPQVAGLSLDGTASAL